MPSLSVDVDNDGNLIKFNPVTISPVSDDKLNSYSNYLSRYGLIVVNLDEAEFITYINKYAVILGYDIKSFEQYYNSTIQNYKGQTQIIINMFSLTGLILANSNAKNSLSMVIPKVYLSNDATNFINLINNSFMNGMLDTKTINLLNAVFTGLNNNNGKPEIKLANLIGLITKIVIISTFTSITTSSPISAPTSPPNIFPVINGYKPSESNMMNTYIQLIIDTLSDFPGNECIFNNSLKFIKFSPDICALPSNVNEDFTNVSNEPTNHFWKLSTLFLLVVCIVLILREKK